MEHIDIISSEVKDSPSDLVIKLTGRYYTHNAIANNLLEAFFSQLISSPIQAKCIRVCDPFAGDGRLVYWLIEQWTKKGLPSVKWDIELWDLNSDGLNLALDKLESLKERDIDLVVNVLGVDSFKHALLHKETFDIVFTNPPWEMIKPDSRELKDLDETSKTKYIESLREYDKFLKDNYPKSQPSRKFAGWGTNLSRVGIDLSSQLLKKKGWGLVVMPASFFADDQSRQIRTDLFTNYDVFNVEYYPAEARLFGKADTSSSTVLFRSMSNCCEEIKMTVYDKDLSVLANSSLRLNHTKLIANGYSIPISIGPDSLKIIDKIEMQYDKWQTIERNSVEGLWAGREIDETGSADWLVDSGSGNKFIKGRMIGRFTITENPKQKINKGGWSPPESVNFNRIIWRDVSRQNQKRRVIATIVNSGFVAGNSLGVCYFKDGDFNSLKILLGIFNSMCFEFQLKMHLATGHISLSSIRKVHIPNRTQLKEFNELSELVGKMLDGECISDAKVEAFVAKKIFKLTKGEFKEIINSFPKIQIDEKIEYLKEFDIIRKSRKNTRSTTDGSIKIPNHLSAKLSELDLSIVNSVPAGGNWKNIPENIPSKRVQTIRESYAAGKGSRSTYYGRLLHDKPSYTINTYFSRPGNGCHIHYDQERVISQREAARLQSFPDNFTFLGSQNSVNNQIGNAVPPLLAFQIAKEITSVVGKGIYIDLFAGAGGMGLGFKWAGWTPIVANDIENAFLQTYSLNVHSEIVVGSITDTSIFEILVEKALKAKVDFKNTPLWVLGGPPCQGFSTAGKKRSMEDERNLLFLDYTKFLSKVCPDGFVFENVSGLLNMDKGEVFKQVKHEFGNVMDSVNGFVLSSENYAIPQRRKRVFLIGQKGGKAPINQPPQLTSMKRKPDIFDNYADCVGVSDAISDLPSLVPGQNGSSLNYKTEASTNYQKLMRGEMSPEDYLNKY